MVRVAKVYFLDGEIIEGRIAVLPKEEDSGFYLSPMVDSLFNEEGKIFIGFVGVKKIEFMLTKSVNPASYHSQASPS